MTAFARRNRLRIVLLRLLVGRPPNLQYVVTALKRASPW